MATLSSVWSQVTALIEDGISVIPVRDKDESTHDGKIKPRKSAFEWKKHQSVCATKEELWFLLEKHNTTAIATVCGKVSKNLEVIDIDIKWEPEIGQVILDEINNLYPDIFSKLRIHKTPSGGFHILYRVEDGVIPGSKKLAERTSTEEELKDNPKAKTKCFVETRGEGGYVVAPPSMDYSILKDNPIPVLKWDEREALILLCKSFNRVLKEDVYRSTSKSESEYYSKNPFEHYNESQKSETVLSDFGWAILFRNNRGIYFSRPGSKSQGIHSVFLFKSRIFYFFTTNSEFDNERCYRAATVRAILAHGGDKKKLFVDLVKEGYGQINPNKEKSIVKKAAINNIALPPNASKEAQEQHKRALESLKQTAAYGVFWELNEKNNFIIHRERLLIAAEGLGYRYYNKQLVQIVGKFVCKKELRHLQDDLKKYIYDEDGDIMIDIYAAYEDWVEKHADQLVTRLQLINEEDLTNDDKDTCWKFYNNGALKITGEKIELLEYEKVSKLIDNRKLQNRNYTVGALSGRYCQFLQLACNYDENVEYIQKIIGFLSHEYKDATTGYIIVLTEECPDPKQGGGSGKNMFTELFRHTTTVSNKSGEQVKFDERFLQSWNGERIFSVSDVPKKFNFIFLKELSTGSGILKKLFKDEREVPVEEMPKFIISTNYSYDVSDGGLARRIIPLEFTDFFTKCGGVNLHFGMYFPEGWNEEDWIGYDNMIAQSVQRWLSIGRRIFPSKLSEGGFTKQFDQVYGVVVRQFIEDNWDDWWARNHVPNREFQELYDNFCNLNSPQYRLTPRKMNDALSDWCKEKKFKFEKDKTFRIPIKGTNPIKYDVYKGKQFFPLNVESNPF